MTSLHVIPIGQPVMIDGCLRARVLSIQICAGDAVRYNVGFWVNGEWKEASFDSSITQAVSDARAGIGFLGPSGRV